MKQQIVSTKKKPAPTGLTVKMEQRLARAEQEELLASEQHRQDPAAQTVFMGLYAAALEGVAGQWERPPVKDDYDGRIGMRFAKEDEEEERAAMLARRAYFLAREATRLLIEQRDIQAFNQKVGL